MKLVFDANVLHKLLKSMYRLPHVPVLHLQDANSCQEFVNLIATSLEGVFKSRLEDDDSEETKDEMEGEEKKEANGAAKIPKGFSADEIGAVNKAISMMKSSDLDVQWFAEYGCAILIHRGEYQLPGMVTISILGLDQFSFFYHHDGGDGYRHESEAIDYKTLVAGTTLKDKLPVFWDRFRQLHAAAQVRDGDRRTAAGGRQGHQFTPTLIHALATQAVNCGCQEGTKCSCPNVIPEGGFTDVGRHTGGEPRNTSFALAKFIFGWCLTQCGFVEPTLFQKAMVSMNLTVLEDRVVRAEEDTERARKEKEKTWKIRANLDAAFRILEVISIDGSALDDAGTSIDFVVDAAGDLRCRMDKTVKFLVESEAKLSIFPDIDKLLEGPDSFRSPRINLAGSVSNPTNESRNYDDRIKKNIGPSNLLADSTGFDLSGLLAWLQSSEFNGKKDTVTMFLRIRTVENVFWNRALAGLDTQTLDETNLVRLLDVVNAYRRVIHACEEQLSLEDHLLVELHSRELLTVWVAYCLAFASVKRMRSDVMANVGVALRYSDLEHLVLSDRNAWKVVEVVAAFLHEHHRPENAELFSMRAPSATFSFAEVFARGDVTLQHVWNAEKRDAQSRMDKHWEKVERKKRKAERLRSEISDLNRRLASAVHEMNIQRSDYNSRRLYDEYASRAALNRSEGEVNSLKQAISSRKSQLKSVLLAPSPVCQPLPRNESKALRWLFFLHMPQALRVLSTLTFTGQQMLVPQPWRAQCDGADGTEYVDVISLLRRTNGESLASFYSSHQEYVYFSPTEKRRGLHGHVALVSPRPISEVLPKRIGPTSVDDMFSREDGVWFPDGVGLDMQWTGGSIARDTQSGQAFDPFRVPKSWVVSYFTEKLAHDGTSLQWAMRLEENSNASSERGNRPLACQDSRPHWLSKPQFLSFCGVRAFPCKQLRNVVVAVLDRALPFDHNCVHALLKQALYHIGTVDIGGKGSVSFPWKYDLVERELVDTMSAVLQHYADELSDSPSHDYAALIVGEVAAFLSDWDQNMKEISRQLADASYKWAACIGEEVEQTENAASVLNLRMRQRMFLGILILCLSRGSLNDDDCKLIIECRALAKNLCVDGGKQESQRDVLDSIERRCDNLIARRIDHVVDVANRNPSFLTNGIQAVIAQVPSGLRWRQLQRASSRFDAAGSDGCTYSLNVLTGTVLVNGLPPSSLPSEILEHGLFKRSFGERNFEVVSKNEVFETVRPVRGFIYRFALTNGGSLSVTEISKDGDELELLDGTPSGIQHWAEELPTRLKQMHSHWLSRGTRTILLRGILFFKRDVFFFLHLSSMLEDDFGYCYVVPDHLRRQNWRETVEASTSLSKLVLHDSRLLDMFAKIEERQFVHFILPGDLESSKTSLDVCLPRFGLNFFYHDGEFHCVEISDFVMSKCQQLEGSLFGSEQYLVIQEKCPRPSSSVSIIVPEGEISRAKLDGSTVIQVSGDFDAHVRWHQYDMHPRFQTLSARTVCSRLYLSALHAATSFLSRDCDSLLTGFERSIELLRQSWVSRVLDNAEERNLKRLASVCKGIHPTLSLLCSDAFQSSLSVSFLYEEDATAGSRDEWKTDPRNSAVYLSYLQCGLLNNRNRLTPIEEQRILGQLGRKPKCPTRFAQQLIKSPPVESNTSHQLETMVSELLKENERIVHECESHEEFPLDTDCETALQQDIIDELISSWTLHKKVAVTDCSFGQSFSTSVARLEGRVSGTRVALENYILDVLSNNLSRSMASGTDLCRISGLNAEATARDLLLAAVRRETILDFNPALQKSAQLSLQEWIIEWLRLCVIEDKLGRISRLFDDEDGLKKELNVIRNWNPVTFPSWLAFEVEHSLQIWPEQASVARHLIDNCGDVVQLNMGMGKTRVIIPLLLLHYAFHVESYGIPRVNILPQLISEGCDYFHQRLTASIFNVKLFRLPFSRDVQLQDAQLGIQRVDAIQSLLNLCRSTSGFVVVAPEHRLSLELKIKELELRSAGGITSRLKSVHDSSWIDILDESDELLHHRNQLIYAIGSVQELPAGTHRWKAAEVLLGLIHGDASVCQWLDFNQGFARRSKVSSKESFRSIQVTLQESMSAKIPDFTRVLAEAVLATPAHEMDWLKGHPLRESIMAALLEENEPAECINDLSDPQRNDVLALRGLLVGGLLIHCLRKRHRVDYGVARPGKKRISVPFRGADTPSLRSEFSHPDCAIVFTIISYYEDGLKESEVVEAFRALLALGPNVQSVIYSQWHELSKHRMKDLASKLDRIEKIDLANQAQLRLLVTFFQKNVKVIDFWLNSCVFPQEMQYYPQRLTATSWNLANNPTHVVGFSGTNDNHRLLPIQMTQYFPDTETGDDVLGSLASTNGRMLELILKKASCRSPLRGSNNVDGIIELLQYELGSQGVQAIIDAGALLAGVSNEVVAQRILSIFSSEGKSRFKGVVFFDNRSPNGTWMALEPSGRLLPKIQSPVRDSDAFAIFDEPRCRGADLKLDKEAVALLTLGPKMCKDKLMQAAGRMRALAQGQNIIITGTEFLFNEVMDARGSHEVTPQTVLEWTLSNTVKANSDGIVPWANQGLFFCTSQGKEANFSVEDEKLSLNDFYGGSFQDVRISSAVDKAQSYHIKRIGSASSRIPRKQKSMMDEIVARADVYGTNMVHASCGTGMDEECERELEMEQEKEEEKEVEIPLMSPLRENDWNKRVVLHAASPSSLPGVAGIISLGDFVGRLQPAKLSSFGWSQDVYGTRNFFETVVSQSGLPLTSLNHYLRMVDMFVLFPDGKILMVSDREAEELIALLWKRTDGPAPSISLCHMSLVRSGFDNQIPGLDSTAMALGQKWGASSSSWFGRTRNTTGRDRPSESVLSSMQLFAGETMYPIQSRKASLKEILRGFGVSHGPAVADPEDIVDARGNSPSFAYSDLEAACRELAREALEHAA